MSTVLWGGRRGDVQYASREFWRRNLRFGVPTIEVAYGEMFDVGAIVEVVRQTRLGGGLASVGPSEAPLLRVDSMCGRTLAVWPL